MFLSTNCLLLDRLCAACVPSVISHPPFVTLPCIQLCLCVAFSGGYVSVWGWGWGLCVFSLLSIVNCSVSQTVQSHSVLWTQLFDDLFYSGVLIHCGLSSLTQCCGLGFLTNSSTVESLMKKHLDERPYLFKQHHFIDLSLHAFVTVNGP